MRGSPKRFSVSKKKSARSFKRSVGRSKAANLRSAPMRGGWRF